MLGSILAANAVALAGLLLILWVVSIWKRDASLVDPFWGAGFVVVAWISFWKTSAPTYGSLLLVAMVTVWGTRLSGFLLWRNRGHGEDYRYQAMRKHHGERFWWVSAFTVFGLQGVLLWIIAMPIQIGIASHAPPSFAWLLQVAGVGSWITGLFFETVGDWQLARFKADPANRGRVCDQGLWRYTRHPNYFGDFCVWWGFYLVAAAQGAWWTSFSPALMSLLLLKVSGVTLLESTISQRRPAYVEYQRRTSAFFPWPPKR